MFERFTDRARRVVVLAQEEARMLNHNYIGTEHILLGLIHEGEGVAAKALESLGISLEAVRQQVEEIIGQGQQAPSGHIPFTPRAKKVLELSLREALQLGHNYIGTEHILLGLIREGEGVAAQVLVKLGADLSRVRQQVIQLLSGYAGGKEAAATGGGSGQESPSGSLVLDQFGRNLTQLAREKKLDPVIGREREIERVMQVLSRRTKNNPVLIGELHTLVGAGAAEGAIDAASILKPMLARGELQTIGATTLDEYRKHLEKDAALERRFQPIKVEEPTVAHTIEILKGIRDRYKAIDLIDEAGSRMRIRRMQTPPDYKELETELGQVRRDKEQAIENQKFEQAAKLRDQEKALLEQKEAKEREIKDSGIDLFDEVDEEAIAE